MRYSAHFALALMLAALLPHAAAQMYKCKDARGDPTYSDMPCVSAARPPGPRRPGQPPPAPVQPGKLTPGAVTKFLEQAAVLVVRSDYRGQCALAARDLSFSITDHSTSPPSVTSGGRREMCAIQQEMARSMEANQYKALIKLDKLDISLDPEGTRATAKYETVTTLTQQGRRVLVQRCAREDVLGAYGNQILYSSAIAVCRPPVDM